MRVIGTDSVQRFSQEGGSIDPLIPLMIESAAKTLRFGQTFPGPERLQTSVTIEETRRVVNPIDVFRFSKYESI